MRQTFPCCWANAATAHRAQPRQEQLASLDVLSWDPAGSPGLPCIPTATHSNRFSKNSLATHYITGLRNIHTQGFARAGISIAMERRTAFGRLPPDAAEPQICRVEMWRGGSRFGLSVAAPFVWRCPSNLAIAPFPHPPHRTGLADCPHPALGRDVTLSSTTRRAQAGSGVRAQNARKGARGDSSRPGGLGPDTCGATTDATAQWCSCRSPGTPW